MHVSPLFSMTGFGRAEQSAGDWHVIAEVKSLNGKQLELNLKLPPLLKTREFEVRGLIANALLRGSIDCTITLRQNGATKPVELNTDLLKAYYRSVKTVSDELGLDTTNILEALLRLPEVVMPVTELVDEQGWQLVTDTLQSALTQLNTHRQNEGAILQTDLKERILAILQHNEVVSQLAALRPDYVRENLLKKIEEQLGKENYDRNRLEQEIVFYIEKMDISEELVRLNNHCHYFLELLDHEEAGKGKKLGFLLQEIGREINTTGAKAYDAAMQKLVVAMKDELEKTKEQILNVL